MSSIVNGLFSARSGISSHGTAIAVIGDNISNASTIGYKNSVAQFADLVAGGQATGRIVGSGSTVNAIDSIFKQGTLEFTSRPLDLAVDGNGFFVVAKGEQRFYTRAGNFKVDTAGYIVTQDGLAVLGYPSDGTGALQPLNTNTISQSSVMTTQVSISGNLDASSATIDPATIPTVPTAASGSVATTPTFRDINDRAQFSTVVNVFDSLGGKHEVNIFYFHSNTSNTWQARAYVKSEDVNAGGTPAGYPRLIGSAANLTFGPDGKLTGPASITATLPWSGGADDTQSITFNLSNFTQYSAGSNVLSITQDGQGVGSVSSLSIGGDGKISALLDNGQSAVIGTIGLANFANAEGLTRSGSNLLQQSNESGEPVVGQPKNGTFGAVTSGSLELSTVDIANEFVKLITLQRGFQANSRIITTINQLLNDIIQLA